MIRRLVGLKIIYERAPIFSPVTACESRFAILTSGTFVQGLVAMAVECTPSLRLIL